MSGVTRATSLLLIVIGVVLVGRTLDAGGGPAAVGIVLGLLFVAAGAGRLWAQSRRDG